MQIQKLYTNDKWDTSCSCFALKMVPNRFVPQLCSAQSLYRIFLLAHEPFVELLCNTYHVFFLPYICTCIKYYTEA